MVVSDLRQTSREVIGELGKAIYGKPRVLEEALTCLFSGGHLLLEDVPGTGKTLLAKSLAQILGVSFQRIQCTPDLLPGDITGSSVFNQKSNEFEFHPGPVFTNVLLADEINRATPRAQAALLESMAEFQVTVDGTTYDLTPPFFVIATQNPVEHEGTFALPEAQLDRFAMRLSIGYPDDAAELEMLAHHKEESQPEELEPVISGEGLAEIQLLVRRVRVAPELARFVISLVKETRHGPEFLLGGGPRATLSLYRACQSFAAINGRGFVLPDDAKRLAPAVLSHRVILSAESRIQRLCVEDAIAAAIDRVPVPIVEAVDAGA